jgi:hypothetical protein
LKDGSFGAPLNLVNSLIGKLRDSGCADWEFFMQKLTLAALIFAIGAGERTSLVKPGPTIRLCG